MATWIKNKHGEIFTFPPGFISSIKTHFEPGVEQQKMPITGPMNNIGIDTDGNGKTITITGRFLDTTSSVTSINNIRSQVIMKYWFESILSGIQLPMEFESYLDKFSTIGEGNDTIMMDTVSGEYVTLKASFQLTKVYLLGFGGDDDEGDPEKTPFTITLWVAGL